MEVSSSVTDTVLWFSDVAMCFKITLNLSIYPVVFGEKRERELCVVFAELIRVPLA